MLFLDAQHRVLSDAELFRGTLTQTSVYPREVVKATLRHNAAALILARTGAEPIIERVDAARERAAIVTVVMLTIKASLKASRRS